MTKKRYFSSESVTEGHPDKMADQISDAVLDAIMANDPNGRVACETALTTGMVMVMGEITTDCYVDVPKIVRDVVKDIGYTNADYGLDYKSCAVLVTIDEQSPDISQGVTESLEFRGDASDKYDEVGAGDQGMMFGYACKETEELMPLPITLAHKLTNKLAEVRKRGSLKYLRPDGKAQVTVEYDGFIPKRIEAVVISTQHDEDITLEALTEDVKAQVIMSVLPSDLVDADTKVYVNPTGRFVIGGPHGDAGLTGRKIIVDTYGGMGRHGGGAFSGKDCTKVDRSAAYACRYIAKNLVAAGFADRLEIQVAYAIGVSRPMSVLVDTFGTGTMDEDKIEDVVSKVFDLRPGAIIDHLRLRRPIYRQTAAYGHFGRNDLDLPWEQLDKVDELKKYL
ncbi:MAG: methionine adenosyltransferase [Candidatus Cloacimonadota bacterium]|nr:MAG: methionine adenosyltransferase [Candidatus Cloacimonadota bacterium]